VINSNGSDRTKFSLEDILKLSSVSGVQLSKNGKLATGVISRAKDNNWQNIIFVLDISSNELKKVAKGSSPKWSPDGKSIAYISEKNGLAAIFIYDVESLVNDFVVSIYESDYFIDHYAINNFCWTPDGKSIVYISALPFDANEESPVSREINQLLFKSKGGKGRQVYADKRRIHIWIVPIEDKKCHPVFISDFNEHSISLSPGGNQVCFISNRSGSPDLNQWSRVFVTDISGENIKQVSWEDGSAFLPEWSPDGKWIAYLGIKNKMSTNDSPAEDTQLYIIPSAGGGAKCLTSSLNRRVEQLSWDSTSRDVYFTAGDGGNTNLYRVSIESSEIEKVIDLKGKVTEYSVSSGDDKVIYIHTDTTHPAEVFLYGILDKSNTQLTNLNGKLINTKSLQPAESFWYKSFDDTNIQGWLIKPVDFDDKMQYPLVLVIHGGPHNMFGYEFEDRMQFLSANGYGVLFINPRGSSGYGQEFSNGCMNNWGGGDYKDLMKGVDVAIESNRWIDAARLGVTGQSYGGYMTNRIITKTNRFKAAVTDGSISNLVSFAGTSLYHSLMESEFQSLVFDNYEVLWECSPLKDVKNVTTPVLFLHGETDNEVPISQAEEMFIALKKNGVETVLVQYKGEGHGWRPDLLPIAKTDLLKRMLNWFDKYLKND
jgi:dipeptidyl aminopeptidase/acylaminoacyl peptidase